MVARFVEDTQIRIGQGSSLDETLQDDYDSGSASILNLRMHVVLSPPEELNQNWQLEALGRVRRVSAYKSTRSRR